MTKLLESIRTVKTPSFPPQPELDDFIASFQCDELLYPDEPSPEDLDWWAAQTACDLPEPVSGILSLPEWIATQAAYLRSLGSDAGDWLAGKIDALAGEVRFTGATTPAQHEERVEVMSQPVAASYSIEIIRSTASLLSGADSALAPDLYRAAERLESILRARS